MKTKSLVLMAVLLVLLVGTRICRAKIARDIVRHRQGITADYVCDGSKTIHAVFYPGKNPRAEIALSDGRKLALRQVLSASGARYADRDERIVFWIKGDTAFIEEDGRETYSNGKAGPSRTKGSATGLR